MTHPLAPGGDAGSGGGAGGGPSNGTGAGVAAPVGAGARARALVRRAGRAADRAPLSVRLVVIITGLLTAGLVVAGVATSTLLSRYLLQQVDAGLKEDAPAVVNRYIGAPGASPGAFGSYYVQLTVDGGPAYTAPLFNSDAAPDLPALQYDDAVDRRGTPFTVAGETGEGRWRVVAYPGTSAGAPAVWMVAVQLSDADATVSQIVRLLLATGAIIVIVGSLTGYLAVQRSLRPLVDMETTAAAIAAGDLSRRVPARPASTEVGRLGEALNSMLAQIESAFAARTASEERMRRFVADASHELRTPLATIRGYGELYRMGALTSEGQVADTMRRVEDSAVRMGSLVNDLLALARLDEGRPLRSQQVDLAVLAADAISDLRALDPSRATRLEPLVAGGTLGPVTVAADEDRLRQVVANLVGNVVQHTPRGTALEIAVGRDGDEAVLEVRDHGPGIPPEHVARVFERFYRIDSSRTRESGGSGLGMAIVAAIVDAHRGRVEIRQTAGGGATVRVSLPASGGAETPTALEPPETLPAYDGTRHPGTAAITPERG